jgi:BlaI family transcriptional regulator, penicillinase repressor
MADPVITLGEFQMQVLRLVWQHQPCTERHISSLVQQSRPVRRTTVLKVLQRLVAKGLLFRVPGERPILFRAALEEKRLLSGLTGRFVERVLGGSTGPLVAYLAESGKLSAKDLKALRAIAEKIGQPPEKE